MSNGKIVGQPGIGKMLRNAGWLIAGGLSAIVLAGCGGGGGGGGGSAASQSVASTNVTPLADAGPIQNVLVSTAVTLDGSASLDGNGDMLTYRWTLVSRPSGSSAALSSETSPRPSFTADVAGTYLATLVVNDGRVDSAAASVTVTATRLNAAPVASAGAAQSVSVANLVTLDGSASSDANGDALTYLWTLTARPSGSAATLSSTTSPRPTFTADAAGTYVASLVVSDGQATSVQANVSITATRANAAPVANAGVAQNVTTATLVTLDGSASADANGDALTYRWTLTSRPAGSAATLSSTTSPRPTFTADVAGTYVATLVVNDGQVDSAAATVTVTATRANAAPVASAGSAQNVTTATLVTLDASASSDANGDTLSYRWTLTSRPTGSAASLSSTTVARPTFTADVAGTYVATLIVNDGQVDSASATVTVTATRSNAAPVASAGTAQSVYLGDLVRLDGSASSDANGDTLTYRWTAQSYPGFFAPTVSGSTTANPTFTASDSGTYVFSLVVNDGYVSSSASTVSVSVANGVGPTASGSGLIVQNASNFQTMTESTMTKNVDFSCGITMNAIDRRPDGVIVGTVSIQLYEINPVSGICSARGTTPEGIRALAVSPSGQVIGVSLSQYSVGSVLSNRLYKLSSVGASQSYVSLSGASTYVSAIDFGPDGQLYGLGIVSGGSWGIVRINTETGVTTSVFSMPATPTLGDIDIDASGVLRTVIGGVLYKISYGTGAVLSTTTIPNFTSGNAFAAIVYVP